MLLRIVVLFLFLFLNIYAGPKHKYNLSVCALFKNESKNIREWIEYHRLIGVDHFYLYENGATDGYMKVLRPYIQKKIVTLVSWPEYFNKQEEENSFKWSLSTQIPAYENVILLHAKEETKWLMFLDVDEFILPVQETLTELLVTYQEYPGIEMDTEFFETIGHSTPTKSLVIESVDITKAPRMNVFESVKKIIFKPKLYAGSKWAPYACLFVDQKEAKTLDKNTIRVNRYLNRNLKSLHAKRKWCVDQSSILPAEKEEILNSGFDIEDQRREIHRFVPEVMQRLSFQH